MTGKDVLLLLWERPLEERPRTGVFDEVWIGGATGSVRDVRAGDLFVALPFVDGDAHDRVEEAFSEGAAMALVSEGWRLDELAPGMKERCVPVADVLSAFRGFAGRFRRRFSHPVIAIGGSNGKTTTKEMLAAVLSGPGRRVVRTPGTDNGFVGLPRTLCDRAHRSDAPPHAVVLEIGIDARGAMAEHVAMSAPDVVILTALGPEHLDGLGDVRSAVEEELLLYENASSARRVVPWADPEIRSRPHLLRAGDVAVVPEAALSSGDVTWPRASAVLVFRAEPRGEVCGVALSWYPEGDRAQLGWQGYIDVPMPGVHHAHDCALAVAAALALGRTPEEVLEGWRTFSPPPWRSRVTALGRGVLLVDDCFNASPLSVRAALAALQDASWRGRPKVAVLGDMLGLGGESAKWHLDLHDEIATLPETQFYFFGEAMSELAERLRASGHGERVGGCLAGGDPVGLIGSLELGAGTVALVKGSRGMRMERVSQYLEVAFCRDRAAAVRALAESMSTIGIVGSHGTAEAARMTAKALRCLGAPIGLHGRSGAFVDDERVEVGAGDEGAFRLACRCFVRGGVGCVEEITHERLAGFVAGRVIRVAVYTGLSEVDLAPSTDAETLLAEKAQVFARGRGLAVAVLCADDPTSDLLAEVIPRSVRVLRYGTAGRASGDVDLLAASIDVTETGTRVTLGAARDADETGDLGVLEIGERGVAFGLGAMAALLVVRALGGSVRSAARHLC